MVADHPPRLLLDCREFSPSKRTGIGRVIEGLAFALSNALLDSELVLAVYSAESVCRDLRGLPRVRLEVLPPGFWASEWSLTGLTKASALFISPYPKLPLFG